MGVRKAYKTITAATLLPVTLSEFKEHLRFTGNYEAEDDTMEIYLNGAISYAQRYLGYPIMSTTTSLLLQYPPNGYYIRLFPHTTSVTHVKYKDDIDDSAYVTLAATEYEELLYDDECSVRIKDGLNEDAYEIQFVSGYTSRFDVPGDIRGSILQIAARAYEKREENIKRMPTNVEDALNLHRDWRYE